MRPTGRELEQLGNQAKGWVTAEYGMLPRSTSNRMRRGANIGKQGA